jgi:hypothetical protein
MESVKIHESYPPETVILSNIVSLIIYASGCIIMFQSGWLVAALYLLYVALFEFRLIHYHCTNCYYYGKTCGFGKGRLSAVFFKKGDPSKFCTRSLTWKDMIPDLLISLIPLLTGIIYLMLNFSLLLFFTVIILLLFSTMGSGYIRSQKICNHCKQRELGCPADALFNKKA